MGFAHLLNTEASLTNFKVTYRVPEDVEISYCHEGNIAIEWHPQVVFFPLMAILEGGVRFPGDPLILRTLRFYALSPDQLPSNFYRIMSCVSRLNQLYGLQLDYHDINFMYRLCSNIRIDYYLKVKDVRVQLILCLPDFNRNSAREYVWVSGNWHANELTYPTSPRDVGRYQTTNYLFLILIICFSCFTCFIIV